MPARSADDTPRPRPRPTPHSDEAPAPQTVTPPTSRTAERTTERTAERTAERGTARKRGGRLPGRDRSSSRELVRAEPPQPAQVVAAAGNAVVTAARVGRLLGRSYLRIAKQLPGVSALEAQAQRLRQAAAGEFARLLEVPQHFTGGASSEEQRVMMLVHNAGSDPEPLRTAMTELLARSSVADSEQSREYLFGSIVSQLVPDEARVLAALAGARPFAAVDVLLKPNGRSGRNQTVLANVSTVGTAAELAVPSSVGTYLSRLQGFGLVDFTYNPPHMDSQFESLLRDPAVAAARASIEAGRQGSAKVLRKAVTLSPLGKEFWAACAPARTRVARRSS